mgnify:FL=1
MGISVQKCIVGREHGKIVLSPTESTENTTLPGTLLVPPDSH